MPVNKSALLRYRIIDSCLTNRQRMYPTMDDIISKIESQLETTLSASMFTKDIKSMRKMYSAPIQYNRLRKGYCYTEDGFSINSFPLSHEEIDALDFSTALLQQLKHTRIFHHFQTAINKVIDGYRISKELGKSETQLLQVEEPVKDEGGQWLEIILQAITKRKCLEVIYHGFGRPEKVHIFSPYLLKEYRNRWYTVGYSAAAKNILVLALDRITTIHTCKEQYIVDNDFSPASFFRYSFGITQVHEAKAEKVELLFTPLQAPYILSQPLHHSQQVIANDDKGLRVKLEVYITQELLMTILSYAGNVKVLAPKKLVKQVKEEIAGMSKQYG
jgi:predicted DNA-binding transcriptional regulator YafY